MGAAAVGVPLHVRAQLDPGQECVQPPHHQCGEVGAVEYAQHLLSGPRVMRSNLLFFFSSFSIPFFFSFTFFVSTFFGDKCLASPRTFSPYFVFSLGIPRRNEVMKTKEIKL